MSKAVTLLILLALVLIMPIALAQENTQKMVNIQKVQEAKIIKDTLGPGEVISTDQFLQSNDKELVLYMQIDGNLVLYGTNSNDPNPKDWAVIWSTNTPGSKWNKAKMTADGDFILLDNGGHKYDISHTSDNKGAYLKLLNGPGPQPGWNCCSGFFAIFTKHGANIWPKGKYRLGPGETITKDKFILSRDKSEALYMQNDGNLVLLLNAYGNPDMRTWGAVWATNTAGGKWNKAKMMEDGDFVLLDPEGHKYDISHTSGHPGAYVWITSPEAVADSSLIVVGKPPYSVIWYTCTDYCDD